MKFAYSMRKDKRIQDLLIHSREGGLEPLDPAEALEVVVCIVWLFLCLPLPLPLLPLLPHLVQQFGQPGVPQHVLQPRTGLHLAEVQVPPRCRLQGF